MPLNSLIPMQRFGTVDFPAERRKTDAAYDLQQGNALNRDAARQTMNQQATVFDEQTKRANTEWLKDVSIWAQEQMQQNPDAYVDFMPLIDKEGQSKGMWENLGAGKFDYTVSSPEEIMKGLQAMQQQAEIGLQGLEQEVDPTYGAPFSAVASGADEATFHRPDSAGGMTDTGLGVPARGSTYNSPNQKAPAYVVKRDLGNGEFQQVLITPTFNPNSGQVELIESELEGEILSRLGETPGERQEREVDTAGDKSSAVATRKRIQKIITDGQEVVEALPVLKRSLALLDIVKTGGVFVEWQLDFAKKLGVETADQGELSANLGKAVLSQLRATFGAAFTQEEGNRLIAIEAGFGKNNDTNIRLLNSIVEIIEMKAKRAIRLAREEEDVVTAQIIEEMLEFELSGGTESASTRFVYDSVEKRLVPKP